MTIYLDNWIKEHGPERIAYYTATGISEGMMKRIRRLGFELLEVEMTPNDVLKAIFIPKKKTL